MDKTNKNDMKYYFVNSKRLAITIEFLTGFKYMIHDHKYDSNKKVYSFENTKEFQQSLYEIMNLKTKLTI